MNDKQLLEAIYSTYEFQSPAGMTEERLKECLELAEWTEDYHGMMKDTDVKNAILELVAEVRRLKEDVDDAAYSAQVEVYER